MTGKMHYIDTSELHHPQRHGADKYYGQEASGYDAKRANTAKHTIEQAFIEDMLSGIPDGSWILDAPCGTGRFFDFYQEHKHCVRALDKSIDMIQEAMKKVHPDLDGHFTYYNCSILESGLEDKCVDASVMCRLTRWLSPEECVKAWQELQRITRDRIIFTARVRNHEHARSYELIDSALDGWKITRDETGVDLDYRIIMIQPE